LTRAALADALTINKNLKLGSLLIVVSPPVAKLVRLGGLLAFAN
jgi:hypothetical protein